MPAKRRRKFQGLYYHSSPPKVLPMNGQIANENGRKRRDNEVKLSTIRIWMHEKDIGKLTRILWAGQGQRLRQQASTNTKVKRFLAAVPYVMNSVKDVHQAVIDNSLETLQANLEPPVPPALVTCRDANGLNLIHKAAGLGHATILEYLITTWPDGVHEIDITGKTPLHWAASAKNNMRCYTLLTQAGCDEEAIDYKMKTPSFYRHKPHDIERAFLTYVPEAPRVSPDIATDWEALSDDTGDGKKLDIKIPETNGFSRQSIAESNENTSEPEMAERPTVQEDEDMSKEDDGEQHESEAVTENEQDKEQATTELENPVENEEEESNDTGQKEEEKEKEEEEDEEKEEEEKEKEEPPESTEEQEDPEEENPDEATKHKEEEPQDEKHQTLTLNDTTTTTPTEDTEADHETKNSEESIKEESSTEHGEDHDTEMDDTENENKEEDIKENDKVDEEIKADLKTKDDEGEEEETSSKTVGEALDIIKEELKDNVKFLANKVKNIFTQNEDETNENDKANDNKEEKGTEEINSVKEENVSQSDEKNHLDYSEEESNTDTKEAVNEVVENNTNGEEKSLKEDDEKNIKEKSLKDDDEKTNQDKPVQIEKGKKTNTIKTAPDIIEDNSNNVKDQAQKIINSPTKETHIKDSTKLQNNKTEEDENNNHTKEIENVKEPTDEDYDKINKSLKEYLEDKDTSLEESQQAVEEKLEDIADNNEESLKEKQLQIGDKLEEISNNVKESLKEKQLQIGDKLEEIGDNVKATVKDVTSQVKNIFNSSAKDEDDKLEKESTDVVVLTPSPTKQLHKSNVDSESSDETADDDEANDSNGQDEEANDAATGDNDQETTENGEGEGKESPTSSLAIEGFVQGEAEDNTVQSQTAAYVHDDEDTRLQNIIASGDMEQLAQIVLNGDGQKLLDIEASEPEIQAFLKNVPNYMTKIRHVHEASRSGSLLNLQQALDRRKFAIAKDEISPNGATPLHVAVLFGHSDIVRYLSARFPETTTITDSDDRTALHYAAVINDNGHFYNVLLQLGANSKVIDKMGHTPEDYFTNESLKSTLSYGQLLKNFGAEELEAQMLSDQGQIENHSYQENPIFKTEQGKYLADNLADPLIKALTQVAQQRPNDPLEYLTNYLHTFVTSRNTNGKSKIQAAIHSGSSQTNSTALVNSPQVPQIMSQMQSSRMNGHIKYDNTDEIQEASIPQIDSYDDGDDGAEDDGNDSDAAVSKKLDERDEHGQSMLHFASARSHRKGGLIHLIEEAKADITYRDELYRTARDVALQANQFGNAKEIDRYLISLVIVGDSKPFEHFAISGYDHIIDVVDDNEMPVIEIAESKGHTELAQYLRTIRPMEELREELHQMIRDNKVDRVMEIANGPNGRWLIKAKNYYGRTALHIAILKESEEIIEHFVNLCPEALKIGDNLERTALHYAMGTNIIESISRILIQNGAKRTYKDLKGRQPSYYFMNKADILRLQEEEDENR